MKRGSLKAALYLFLVFAGGTMVGAVGYRLYMSDVVRAVSLRHDPEELRRRYMEEMRSRLQLNDRQYEQLGAILDAMREQFRAMRDRHKPEIEALRRQEAEEIRAILTPAQFEEYEKLRKERELRRQKAQPRGGF
jgi:hypothetical protein